MNNTCRTALWFSLCLVGFVTFFNPAFAAGPYTENVGTEGDGNFTVGPEYTTDKDLTDQGNPKGRRGTSALQWGHQDRPKRCFRWW